MDIINPLAAAYIQNQATPLDPVKAENETFTMRHHPHAQMHSGHVQGKVLEMLSFMIAPRKILEIGTFTGFSAMCLAAGLLPGGKLHTIELRNEDADTAASFFEKAGIKDRVELHRGDAKKIIPRLNEIWDLVFIDADKTGYIEYYDLTLPQVRPGGWIIADNVLFHGEVLTEQIEGKNPKAINEFNEHVKKDPRTEQVILSVRDGLMVIRKK